MAAPTDGGRGNGDRERRRPRREGDQGPGFGAAAEAGEAAENYVLAVVLLAAALFLLGIQTRIGIFELRLAMSGIAATLVIGTTLWILTLPTSVAL
jgi:hypothetical protein